MIVVHTFVKCPKCKELMQVPAKPAQPLTTRKSSAAVATAAAHNPLLDLLDEAGVEEKFGIPPARFID